MYDPPLFPGEEQAWNGSYAEVANLVAQLCQGKYVCMDGSWYRKNTIHLEDDTFGWTRVNTNTIYTNSNEMLRDHLEKRRTQVLWNLTQVDQDLRVHADTRFNGIIKLLWMTLSTSYWGNVMAELQLLLYKILLQCDRCQTYCSRYMGYTHFCSRCWNNTVRKRKILFDPIHQEMMFTCELPSWYHNEARKAEEHFNTMVNAKTDT